MKKEYTPVNRKPSHPGEILKSGFIEQYNFRVDTIAILLGITRGHLSRIINGHNPITSDIAFRLEALTQTPASQWLMMQSTYDAYMIEKDEGFQQYKDALQLWRTNSLTMMSPDRQNDKTIKQLVKEAGTFAKELGNKETPAKGSVLRG